MEAAKMNQWREFDPSNGKQPYEHHHSYSGGGAFEGNSLFENLRQLWHWDELAAEISQESQARVAVVGLTGSGKSTLYNHLRGWQVAKASNVFSGSTASGAVFVESYGTFVLADLPQQERLSMVAGEELILALGDPALTVYLLDGELGVQDADSRWVSVLRACGKPLLLVLNKADAVLDLPAVLAETEQRLGLRTLPASATTGQYVERQLLPAMMDAVPRLAVPLGREIVALRRLAARRVIRRVMVLAGMMSAQPVPLLDIPFQVMLQVGLVMRVGAVYGHTPAGGFSWEVAGAVAGSLGLTYLAQTVVKFVPILGWAASGILGGAAAWTIGEAAILYHEGAVTKASAATVRQVNSVKHRASRLASKLGRVRPLPTSSPEACSAQVTIYEIPAVAVSTTEDQNEL